MHTLDYVAIVIYMLIVATIGTALGFFVKNISDYFKGGSTIPWYVGGISNFMGLFSTFVFVAYAGIAYEHGLVALTIIWCAVPATLIGGLIFAKKWRRAGIVSPVEFMEERFSSPVRQVFSWGGIFFRVLDNMVRLYAIGVFISTATPLSLNLAIFLAGIIVVFYTVVGGLWAVVLTDVVQFFVLIAATLILVPLSLRAVGGFGSLTSQLPDHFTLFHGPKGNGFYLLVYYLMFTIKNNGNWSFIQRFYSVKDESSGRKMGILTAVMFFVFPIFFFIPAIASAQLFPNLANNEMAYVTIALELLPSGIMGLMLAAMFAATMSSLDSEYNVIASVITSDIYKRYLRPQATEKEMMRMGRVATLIVGSLVIVGALYVEKLGGAFEASKLFTGLFAIPLVIPVIFGVLVRKANATGALLSLVLGVLTGIILNFLPGVSWEMATFLTIVVCLLSFLGSSYWSKRSVENTEKVNAFFTKLDTPIAEQDKPAIDIGFQRVLLILFMMSLAAVGILFLFMGFPSVAEYSGQLAMGAGGACLLVCLGLYFFLPPRSARV